METIMTYRMIMMAALMGFVAVPVAAQEIKACDDDTLSMVIEEVEAASEDAKPTAMAELQMAKDKMAEGDADACSVHLTNASKVALGG